MVAGIPAAVVPHRVDRVTRRDHTALHDSVGVLAGLALAQVESRCLDVLGVDLLLTLQRRAGIDAQKQRDQKDNHAADAAADRETAAGPAATAAGRRGARVDLHALAEGHRTAPLHLNSKAGSQPSSASHTTIQACPSLPRFDDRAHVVGRFAGTTEGGVGVWRGVSPTPSSRSGSADSWRPPRWSRGQGCAPPSNTDRCRRRAGRLSAVDATIRRSATRPA